MSVTVVRADRREARVAVGSEVIAAAVVLRHAQQADTPDRECLDPLERMELADIVKRADAFAASLAER